MIARKNFIDKTDTDPEMQNHKNDIWYENGGFATCSGKEAYAQTIEAVIKTLYGEIQVDREYGIPYFNTIWTSVTMLDRWALAVRNAVSELPFVIEIVSFTYSVDSQAHQVNYALEVKVDTGEVVLVEN